ncbi:MAG: ABC transporter substrate-binding protein [Caldilineaceae bacterium]|nr:ABC transporter substrate-binding protein [Caldilineaceae bacterium]
MTVSETSRATTLSAATIPPRDTLRVAIAGTPKHFDPALFSVTEEYQLGFAVFDGLVWVDEMLVPQPMLAEAWESSPDLMRWTFQLRENVLFHHGTPFTAADVVHTFTRILNPSANSTFRNTLSFLEAVEAVDDYTVRFTLKSPSAELPVLLGAPQAQIVAHDYDSVTLDKQPSGTGPFQFIKNLPGERVQLARNSTYWQTDRPQLAAVEFIFMPYATQIGALQRNEIDMMMQVGMADRASLLTDPMLTLLEVAGGAYQSIVLRATIEPFKDIRVREALKYCMDREAFGKEQLQQRADVGNDHPVAPISAFYADLPVRPYDPVQARTLLAAAGYTNGLQLDLLTSTVRPGMVELALAFQTMAKPAGININVIRTPPQVYWSDYAGRVPFHTGNWGFRPSIDETFMVAYHSLSKGNESRWHNATLDNLIDEARGEANREERQNLYHQAQQLIMEQGAVIIPYFLPTIMAKRANVQGFTPHPSGWLNFRNTYFG